jgi:hypothetical protein
MSVYSGFATRNHETVYNTVLFKLINVIQFRLKLYSQGVISEASGMGGEANDDFKLLFGKLFVKLKTMEEYKYCAPRFSYSMHDIADHLGFKFENRNSKTNLNKVSTESSDNSSLKNNTVHQMYRENHKKSHFNSRRSSQSSRNHQKSSPISESKHNASYNAGRKTNQSTTKRPMKFRKPNNKDENLRYSNNINKRNGNISSSTVYKSGFGTDVNRSFTNSSIVEKNKNEIDGKESKLSHRSNVKSESSKANYISNNCIVININNKNDDSIESLVGDISNLEILESENIKINNIPKTADIFPKVKQRLSKNNTKVQQKITEEDIESDTFTADFADVGVSNNTNKHAPNLNNSIEIDFPETLYKGIKTSKHGSKIVDHKRKFFRHNLFRSQIWTFIQ